MCKEQNVLNYYVVCNKLKNVIRTGWKDWKVKRERIESVAEHIYGVQMLAIAMKSEYQYDIDMQKVIFMLAIHELGETVIGDLTQFQISREKKERIEHEAVHKILSGLIDGEQIERIFLEFDAHKTAEAKFADMIWDNEPISSSDLAKLANKYFEWKKTTSFTVLKRLCERELFQNQNGMVTSLISRKEYYARHSELYVDCLLYTSDAADD